MKINQLSILLEMSAWVFGGATIFILGIVMYLAIRWKGLEHALGSMDNKNHKLDNKNALKNKNYEGLLSILSPTGLNVVSYSWIISVIVCIVVYCIKAARFPSERFLLATAAFAFSVMFVYFVSLLLSRTMRNICVCRTVPIKKVFINLTILSVISLLLALLLAWWAYATTDMLDLISDIL